MRNIYVFIDGTQVSKGGNIQVSEAKSLLSKGNNIQVSEAKLVSCWS